MSSYFDTAAGDVRDIAEQTKDNDEQFLERAGAVEDAVIKEVFLNAGDREFPDDLRQRILNAIALERINAPGPATRGRRTALAMRYSPLIEELHSAYHVLAGRRVETRFGHWTDNPHFNLELRDDHDGPPRRD